MWKWDLFLECQDAQIYVALHIICVLKIIYVEENYVIFSAKKSFIIFYEKNMNESALKIIKYLKAKSTWSKMRH